MLREFVVAVIKQMKYLRQIRIRKRGIADLLNRDTTQRSLW